MASLEQPDSLTTINKDHILCESDKLYQNINVEHELLLPSDLPTCIHSCKKYVMSPEAKKPLDLLWEISLKPNYLNDIMCHASN